MMQNNEKVVQSRPTHSTDIHSTDTFSEADSIERGVEGFGRQSRILVDRPDYADLKPIVHSARVNEPTTKRSD